LPRNSVFLAFALTAAANVRTLGAGRVLFAPGVAYYRISNRFSARELMGIVLIVIVSRCWWRL